MENTTKKKLYDVAVIGLGPAGLSALVYLLEAHLNVIAVGPEVGGQINDTPEITNWPFIPAVSGEAFQKGMLAFFENLERKFLNTSPDWRVPSSPRRKRRGICTKSRRRQLMRTWCFSRRR